jgi:hypothetical protein
MSEQSKSDNPEKRDLREDELVRRLRPDPAQPRPLTVLSGFLGRAPRNGYWRLFLTSKLDEYVEIAEDDIVSSKTTPESASSLGGTTVWVQPNASLQYTRVTSREIQAEFLTGSITANLQAMSAVFRFAMARAAYPQNASHLPRCPNFTNWCESDVAQDCPTKIVCFTDTCNVSIPGCGTANCVEVTVGIC